MKKLSKRRQRAIDEYGQQLGKDFVKDAAYIAEFLEGNDFVRARYDEMEFDLIDEICDGIMSLDPDKVSHSLKKLFTAGFVYGVLSSDEWKEWMSEGENQ